VGSALDSPTFSQLIGPLEAVLSTITPLASGCNKPLSFTFDFQVKSLVYYHTTDCTSGQDLLQAMQEDAFVRHTLVPEDGLGESTFYEANAHRGMVQMLQVLDRLSKKVSKRLRIAHLELGELVAIDGSLLEASLSMKWADYSDTQHKAKVHVGFDLNRGIPRKLYLTDGKGAERPFVSLLLEQGQTGVIDRGYQDHTRFDAWIDEGKHFVARIKKNTQWEILKELPFAPGTHIFFFAKVRLGDEAHRMEHPGYLVGFRNRGKVYWVITDRDDLTAEEIAFIFSLRWEIECFFAWWKKHLKVYHLISRNQYGVLLQVLAGFITYLLLVLYFYQTYGEQRPSIRRLRQLRRQIQKETGIVIYHVIYLVYLQTERECLTACRTYAIF
jgi:hypothetical protein